jgi:hypothetical protein
MQGDKNAKNKKNSKNNTKLINITHLNSLLFNKKTLKIIKNPPNKKD